MSESLKLLSGEVIYANSLHPVFPLKIADIRDIGVEKYNRYLSNALIDKSALEMDIDLTDYKLIALLVLQNEDFKLQYFEALGYFLREKIKIDDDGYFYYVRDNEDIAISESDFEEIIRIIKLQNCIIKDEETDENPSSAKAKQLLEKRRKAREEIERIKSRDGDSEPLTWGDLVSILCANGNGVTIFNVWDMSIYAFDNQFNRMKMLEEYDINIRSLLAGASKDEVELKHWMTKI